MKIAEILSVGDELLLGDTVDTNATFLSRGLREAGYTVLNRQTCGDREESIVSALSLALSRSDVVLVTGGLGPTYDDITRQATAKAFGVGLYHSEEAEKDIRAYFQRRGVTMSENNLLQAQCPEGARIMKNLWGTAPALWMESEKGSAILLPGVPGEMKELFSHYILPELKKRSGITAFTRILHLYGIPESTLDEKLKDITAAADPVVAPYAGGGEVELHITSFGKNQGEAMKKCLGAEEKVRALVGEFIYGEGDTSLEKTLVGLCKEKGITLSTAESCTGGLLSHRITSVPGASAVMSLGVASYTELIKEKILSVSHDTLATDGVYSAACALEMARGVRDLSGADVGIGITGIAGPDGGTEKDPVGTVYLAVVSEKGEESRRVVFGAGKAGRDTICHLASSKALAMTIHHCQNFLF